MRYDTANELLNRGMRLGCLQELLGYSFIEMTWRYAELTDIIRMEEYILGMAKIERKVSVVITDAIINGGRLLKRYNY